VIKKVALIFLLIGFVTLAQPAMAQEPAAGTNEVNKWIVIAGAFGLGFAAAICGIAQSIAFRSAAEGISRNPGAADTIRGMLILGLAFIESLAIYALLVALIMLFIKWGT
jgi:F-type H+-transporting ATPase subunit c